MKQTLVCLAGALTLTGCWVDPDVLGSKSKDTHGVHSFSSCRASLNPEHSIDTWDCGAPALKQIESFESAEGMELEFTLGPNDKGKNAQLVEIIYSQAQTKDSKTRRPLKCIRLPETENPSKEILYRCHLPWTAGDKIYDRYRLESLVLKTEGCEALSRFKTSWSFECNESNVDHVSVEVSASKWPELSPVKTPGP